MISAFVPTLNNETTIRRVLQGLKAQTVKPKKIVVIDSGSTDKTEEICRSEGVEFYPKEYFGNFERLGLGRARNRILELIDTPYILSVDSDIIVRPDHIERALPIMEADPNLGGIAGKQIELHRSELGDRCRAVVEMRDLHQPISSQTPQYKDFILGSNNIYRVDALHKVGIIENNNKFRPYEDKFMSNYEDVDIGIKLRKQGYKLLWDPSIHTYHLQKDDVRSFIDRAYRYRVFKWQLQGAFEDAGLYRRKIEHNINYTQMGFDILCEKSRWYLSYPFIIAGFTFFLEDISRFTEGHPMASKIYSSFIKSLDFFVSDDIKEGVLEYNKKLLDQISTEPTDDIDDEIFAWFLKLAKLEVFNKKFPAMHDKKTIQTDVSLKQKAVEASKYRMSYEDKLAIYGDFKVLLANPPWQKDGRFGVNAGSRWPHTYDMSRYDANLPPYIPYPFFMGHLYSMLQNTGISSWVIDGIAEGYSDEEFIYEIYGYAPNLIFIETSAPSFENDLQYASSIKEFIPETKICMTGSHVSYLKEKLLDYPAIDFGIIKEYEETGLILSQALKADTDYSKISGLIYRSGDKAVFNETDSDTDFKSLPRPERVITPFFNYNDRPIDELVYPSLQVQLSRGCPFKCTFCLWPHTFYGKKYRTADPQVVADEIKSGIENFGIKSFYVDDDTFNVDMKHLHRFCDSLEVNDINLPWMAMARADGGLDEDLIIRMKANGLTALKFGIESIDEDVLKEINKKLDIAKCEETLKLCRKHGIGVHLTFSIGYIADTEETIKKTFNWLVSQNPDSQQVSIVVPFPGTPMHDQLIKKGILDDNKHSHFDGNSFLVFENRLGHKLTERLKDKWNTDWNSFKQKLRHSE